MFEVNQGHIHGENNSRLKMDRNMQIELLLDRDKNNMTTMSRMKRKPLSLVN